MKINNYLIVNIIVIFILVVMRISVMGWLLILFGALIFPVIIFHFITTTIGFASYHKLSTGRKAILWSGFLTFIIFILFQYEVSDKSGCMIIEGFIRNFIEGYENRTGSLERLSTMITVTSGIATVALDIALMYRFKKKMVR